MGQGMQGMQLTTTTTYNQNRRVEIVRIYNNIYSPLLLRCISSFSPRPTIRFCWTAKGPAAETGVVVSFDLRELHCADARRQLNRSKGGRGLRRRPWRRQRRTDERTDYCSAVDYSGGVNWNMIRSPGCMRHLCKNTRSRVRRPGQKRYTIIICKHIKHIKRTALAFVF